MCSSLSDSSSIIIITQGQQGYYGNNVTLRGAYLPSSAQRAWIDYDNPLPDGILRQFFIYIQPFDSIDAQSSRIRLQIWRPIDLTEYLYNLVFETIVQIQAWPQTGALYTVSQFVIVMWSLSLNFLPHLFLIATIA